MTRASDPRKAGLKDHVQPFSGKASVGLASIQALTTAKALSSLVPYPNGLPATRHHRGQPSSKVCTGLTRASPPFC